MQEAVSFHGSEVSPSEAVRLGWESLRNVMRMWGVNSREELSSWLGDHRFPRNSPGTHISARAQEYIFGEANRIDARVSLMKTVFVMITIHMSREATVVPQPGTAPSSNERRPTPQQINSSSWEQLDEVDLDEMFLMRAPMLKKCPRFLRGRLRFSFLVALRERLRCKLDGNRSGEDRAWKLFALVPMMLLHRPRHMGSVGRDELAKRVDRFTRGQWSELIAEVRFSASRTFPAPTRRGLATQSRVQRGQVSRARHELTGVPLAPKNDST